MGFIDMKEEEIFFLKLLNYFYRMSLVYLYLINDNMVLLSLIRVQLCQRDLFTYVHMIS